MVGGTYQFLSHFPGAREPRAHEQFYNLMDKTKVPDTPDFKKATLGELLNHTNKIVRRGAWSALKALIRDWQEKPGE